MRDSFWKMRDESDQVKIPSVQSFSSVASEVPVKYIIIFISFSKEYNSQRSQLIHTSYLLLLYHHYHFFSPFCFGKIRLCTILIIKAIKNTWYFPSFHTHYHLLRGFLCTWEKRKLISKPFPEQILSCFVHMIRIMIKTLYTQIYML